MATKFGIIRCFISHVLLVVEITDAATDVGISDNIIRVYIYCTQRNFFDILLNQTEIRLYLPFPIDLEQNGRPLSSELFGKW